MIASGPLPCHFYMLLFGSVICDSCWILIQVVIGRRDLEDQRSVGHRQILGPRNGKRASSVRAQRISCSETPRPARREA